jgi:hypothetical protein
VPGTFATADGQNKEKGLSKKKKQKNKYCTHAGVVRFITPACVQYHLPGSYARQTCHQISAR